MSIQQIVNETNRIIRQAESQDQLSKRVLAVGIEINQLYSEYLEKLETADFNIQTGVTVEIDGKTVHFKNDADFSEWLVGHLS